MQLTREQGKYMIKNKCLKIFVNVYFSVIKKVVEFTNRIVFLNFFSFLCKLKFKTKFQIFLLQNEMLDLYFQFGKEEVYLYSLEIYTFFFVNVM